MSTLNIGKRVSRGLLIVMIIVMGIGFMSFAESPNYLILSVSPSISSDIEPQDHFNVEIVVKNITGDELEDVYLTVNSSSFKTLDGINTIKVNGISVGPDEEMLVSLDLMYLGGSGTLNFNMDAVRSDDGTAVPTEALSVSLDVESEPSTPVVEDTSGKVPQISIDNSDVHTYHSGQRVELKVPVANTSGHSARDLKLFFTDSLEQLPFSVLGTSLEYELDKVSAKKTEVLVIDAMIAPSVAPGIHELEVRMEFENLYDDRFSVEDRLFIEIKKGEIEPVVMFDQLALDNNEVLAVGDTDRLSLVFYNGGSLEARNIQITVDSFSEEGVQLNRDIESKYIQAIKGGGIGYVSYQVRTGNEAKTQRYQMTGTISYTDLSGSRYERPFSFKIPVQGMDTDQVEVSFGPFVMPSNLVPGETFTVSSTVTNESLIDIEQMDVHLVYSNEIIARSRKVLSFSGLQAGETKEISYELMIKPESGQSYYGIDVVADYYASGDTGEDTQSAEDYLGIDVGDAAGGGRPKLIVDSYAYGGEAALAGEIIVLEMGVKNTSKVEAVKNIKVTFSDSEGVFTPVNSSNALFIDMIPAGEVSQQTMSFKVKADATVKNYQMNVKMEYEDSAGHAYDAQANPFIETEELSINVVQPIRLEMGDTNLPFELTVGQPFNVEMDFFNMGKSTMYNMMIKMEGNFTVQDGNYFVGNFDMGRSDYYSGVLIPNEPGTVEGRILFTFEDALGNIIEREKALQIEAVEMEFVPDEGIMMEGGPMPPNGFEEEPQSGFPWYGYVLALVGVIGVTALLVKRRRAKKKALMELEDDDESY